MTLSSVTLTLSSVPTFTPATTSATDIATAAKDAYSYIRDSGGVLHTLNDDGTSKFILQGYHPLFNPVFLVMPEGFYLPQVLGPTVA